MEQVREEKLDFNNEGVSEQVPVAQHTSSRRNTKLDDFEEKFQDTNFPIHELSKLVTQEIWLVLKAKHICEEDPSLHFMMKIYSEQIKDLREFAKSIGETDVLSKRDILNFDGPKFQYVFIEIVEMFKKSLKDAGVIDSLATNIMKHFADAMRMKEPDLRREVQKIESSGGTR